MKHSLYGGEIVLDFDPRFHVYTLDGVEVDGVSRILERIAKPKRLQLWQVKTALKEAKTQLLSSTEWTKEAIDDLFDKAVYAPDNQRDAASTHGTSVHTLLEEYIKEKHDVLPIKLDMWVHENVDHFIDSERVVYSRRHLYCGTLDFTAVLKDGRKVVGDLKTSGGVYANHALQTVAYQYALEEETNEKYDARIIVRLGKDGTFEVKEFNEFNKDLRAFMGVLRLHKRLKELESVYN